MAEPHHDDPVRRFQLQLLVFAIWGDVEAEAIEGHRTPFLVAFWLFTVIAATDFLDGYLARRDQVVTAFGRIADPFTDKGTILGTMVYLSLGGRGEQRRLRDPRRGDPRGLLVASARRSAATSRATGASSPPTASARSR